MRREKVRDRWREREWERERVQKDRGRCGELERNRGEEEGRPRDTERDKGRIGKD